MLLATAGMVHGDVAHLRMTEINKSVDREDPGLTFLSRPIR